MGANLHSADPAYLEVDGVRIAFRASPGRPERASLVWLGGFHSDMKGEKASGLHGASLAADRAFVRFDYLGHGESAGRFADGTIGRWRADALAVIDRLTTGPLVLVGSSMGGWMALLAALARPDRVRGLVLVAPAPDFTERLMWNRFEPAQRLAIVESGFWTRPSPHDPAGYPITRALIEEGRDWSIMDAPIPVQAPVRILHGARDADVPWAHSFELVDLLAASDVRWELVKDGDHRLSRPQDIAHMISTTLALADQVDSEAVSAGEIGG
jgi:hypothetical protein